MATTASWQNTANHELELITRRLTIPPTFDLPRSDAKGIACLKATVNSEGLYYFEKKKYEENCRKSETRPSVRTKKILKTVSKVRYR